MNGAQMNRGRVAGLFLGAVALRLALFTLFPGLPDLLSNRVEISTPVTSFKRLQEGLFLYEHNVSPYDGGVYHQAPLLLPLFSLLSSFSSYPLFTYLLYTTVDLLNAQALRKIADSGEAGASALFTSPRRHNRWSGDAVAALYLFNPFTIMTCIGRPTSVFTTCAILHAVASAIARRPFTAMIALSFATYLSLYPVLLLPPLLLLAHDRQGASPTPSASLARFTLTSLGVSLASFLLLLYISHFISPITAFIPSTYGVQLTLSDLTPNIGLWWYFFIEMFDSFRAFFLAAFWLHLASYVGGLTLRVRRQPLAVVVLLLGITAIFKPYPSISDCALFLALVPLFRHVFPLMRYAFLTAAVVLYASFLGPAFYHLWIYAGSGNANFFYAITLVWSLGQSLLVSDLTFAILRDEWEVERPDMVGKDVRQI